MPETNLEALLNPRSIAVVGASQRLARGTRVVRNLQGLEYGGAIYPINPKYDEVLGLPCYPSLKATPQPADCVVVAIPAAGVPALLEEGLESGVKAAVVLSAGFSEAGEVGRERHAALQRLAERGMAICGPNCYGVLNLSTRAAAFSGDIPDPLLSGNVALISQSGGFSNVIANPLIEQRGIGFKFMISCGNQAGVAIEDYMDYLVDDPDVQVIAGFVEGFRKPAKLRQVAARAAAKRKAIVVMKVGRSENARMATLAHTGSLAGSAEIVQAALEQSGIVRVSSLNALQEAIVLFSQAGQRTSGWRLGVLTGSGGESGHVCDVAEDLGFQMPQLTQESADSLQDVLVEFAQVRNPLDGTGAMFEDERVFPRLFQTLVADKNIDVAAMELGAFVRKGGRAPQRAFAEQLPPLMKGVDRLTVAYSTAIRGEFDPETLAFLRDAGIPYLLGTETALEAIAKLNAWRDWLKKTPSPSQGEGRGEGASEIDLSPTLSWPGEGVSFLDSKALLEQAGISVVRTELAHSPAEAKAAAERIGYPAVLKIESPDVQHKSDAGGVLIGCRDAAAGYEEVVGRVKAARPNARIEGVLVQAMAEGGVEMLLGVKNDPDWGPAVVLGFGGIYTEVLRDAAIRVLPLDEAEAESMVRQLRGKALLEGLRGKPPADVRALVKAVVAMGRLAGALNHRLVALDVNPLLVLPAGHGVLALDALVELK
ncbi:MAG TPA: acetate--CoA ligase family protein [Chloroflexota bacterium]|nr:acetate--CoA ligase family protein [Chloroflexota bacterium]